MLDRDAIIQDVTVSNTVSGEFVKTWLGRPWIETVAESGVDKVQRSLDDARSDGVSAYSRIVQRFPSGLELPMEFTTVRLGDSGGLVAVGRNLQASSELQSRLIAAQQAMERDYWKLREVETRYRLLFDASNDAVLILALDDLCVVEANPAAIRALGLARGWAFLDEIAPRELDLFRAMLARVREGGRAPGGVFHIGAQQAPWILRASLMNDDTASVYMVQLVPVEGRPAASLPEPATVVKVVQHIPDGFVVIDGKGLIQSANQAFLDMAGVGAFGEVVGQELSRWLCGPGADPLRLVSDLGASGALRMVSATIQDEGGGVIQVEISAGRDLGHEAGPIGVVLREVGARKGGLAPPALPALAQAGRTPLKALVKAAVAVVERHYVESALRITDGNRTAAAGRLGLSRQSLYAKLYRYGLEADPK